MNIDLDKYMTASEAKDALGVTRQRIHQLVKNGELEGRSIGRTTLVTRESVCKRKGQVAA